MLGKMDLLRAHHFQRVAPTTLPHKHMALIPPKHSHTHMLMQHCVWNTLNLHISLQSCKLSPISTIHQPSVSISHSLRELHAGHILKALFIRHWSGEVCVCHAFCVCLHLSVCEAVRIRGTLCLFYYSYSRVDPLSARTHMPEIHTEHDGVLTVFPLQPPFLSVLIRLFKFTYDVNAKFNHFVFKAPSFKNQYKQTQTHNITL